MKVAHFCSMCGPHFCSMTITQDVRDYAASQGVGEKDAMQKGMQEKAVEFVKKGAESYHQAGGWWWSSSGVAAVPGGRGGLHGAGARTGGVEGKGVVVSEDH